MSINTPYNKTAKFKLIDHPDLPHTVKSVRAKRPYAAPQILMELVELEDSLAASSALIDTTNNESAVLQSWEAEIERNETYSW